MNEIEISGRLEDVIEHTSQRGAFLTATLKFTPTEGILIVAAGPAVRELQPYDNGGAVCITARLATHKDNFALLVQGCGRWTFAAPTKRKFAYDSKQAGRTLRELAL